MNCKVLGLIAGQWEPMELVDTHLEVSRKPTIFKDKSEATKAIADSIDYYTAKKKNKRLTYSILEECNTKNSI